MTTYSDARNSFDQNVRLFDPHDEPEKFNLYSGLCNLVDAIENDMDLIHGIVEEIRKEIKKR